MLPNEFIKWNERMFKKFGNLRYYYHPCSLIRLVEKRRAAVALKKLDVGSKDRILDVGCGDGFILRQIQEGEAVGLDISTAAAENAMRLCQSKGASVVRADGENLPFRGSCFNKIVCSETLEHTRKPKSVVDEILRVSKSNGVVVITIPHEKAINVLKTVLTRLKFFDFLLKGSPLRMDEEWHVHAFDLGLLMNLLRGKFRILDVSRVPIAIAPLGYVVRCTRSFDHASA